MQKRRRIKHVLSLRDRLELWADEVREKAAGLPPGGERDSLLKKAGQADVASHLDDWVNAFTIGSDGKFVGIPEPLICDDDDQALKQAKQLLDGHNVELWSGPRLVGRLEGKK